MSEFDNICYMCVRESLAARMKSDALAADELHERSRELLVGAVRAGSQAGMTQREIAEAIGRSQPEVSRLRRFQARSKRGRVLSQLRQNVRDIAATYGIDNVQVFGSVARGTDSKLSDIDLLIDRPDGMGLFSIARLEGELSELLGSVVDVVPRDSLRGHLADRVRAEAVPL